jgi:hypothetical protein
MIAFFPTGLPPLSIHSNGKNKFTVVGFTTESKREGG